MKRIHCFILLCLFLVGISSLNAQVTIGKNESPKDFSLLELNTADSKLGLRLPQLTTLQRNALTQTTDAQAAPALAEGLMIYNLDTGCVDYWNGSLWIANCDDSSKADCLAPCDCDGDGFLSADCGGTDPDDKDACNPAVSGIAASPTSATAQIGVPVEFSISGTGAAINNLSADGGKTFVQGNKISLAANKIGANEFTIMVNNCASQTATVTINASPCQAITALIINACNGWTQGYMFSYQSLQLTAAKSGDGTPLEYEWYVDGVLAAKTTTDTWTYTTPPAGTHTVKVAAANACSRVESADFSVRVVAATYGILSPIELNREGGGTLKFAHVNLGAEFELNPCQMLGDLYQWGRPADGHQDIEPRDANSTTLPDRFTTTLAATNIPGHDKYIYGNNDWRQGGGEITRWGDGTQNEKQDKAANDPCPQGWKVPSQKQWQFIFKASGYGSHSTATANTWTRIGTFSANSSSAYIIGEDLFLPNAGFRSYIIGNLAYLGVRGYYWTSTVNANSTYQLLTNGIYDVDPTNTNYRSHSLSVRCIEDKDYHIPPFNPDNYAIGTGTFSGKTCFDVVGSNFGTACGTQAGRAPEKANFAQTATNTQTYSFTPSATVSKIRFYMLDPTGQVIESITPTNAAWASATNLNGTYTATVKYKTDLNTTAAGKDRANALNATLYVVYNDNATGTGVDKRLELKVSVQDCTCCPGYLATGGEYIQTTSGYLTIASSSNWATVRAKFTATGKDVCFYKTDAKNSRPVAWNIVTVNGTGNLCATDAEYVDASHQSVGGWRMPTLAELGAIQSVYDKLLEHPASAPGTTNLLINTYLSRTERDSSYAWMWRFSTQFAFYTMKTNGVYVRCVRSVK